jgi:hypothetical protein
MKQASVFTSAIAMAVAAFTGTLYAQEPVRTGTDYSKPGRQINDNVMTSRQRFDKPGREIDDGTFVPGRQAHKARQVIEDETLLSRRDLGGPGQRRGQSVRKIRKKVIED